MDRTITLRKSLMDAKAITCKCDITANYGDRTYEFTLDCDFDEAGNLSFTVIRPESISGISGRISGTGGTLVFDQESLSFPLIADGYLSPVSSPWLFMKALRSGRIDSCGTSNPGFLIRTFDSYSDQTMQVDIYTQDDFTPYYSELLWDGRRVLSLQVSELYYL